MDLLKLERWLARTSHAVSQHFKKGARYLSGFFYFRDVNTNNIQIPEEHLFRNEFAKAVAHLSAKYGHNNLELAEDAVQEALIKAMQVWPYDGIPKNTTGWIVRVAQNKLLDQLRRNKKLAFPESLPDTQDDVIEFNDDLLKDDLVKMMFACCNPTLSEEQQVILTLKILCGLSIKEISSALLKSEEAIAKAYTRAKKKFKEEEIDLKIRDVKVISSRISVVLKVIYLLFNEGYKSATHEQLIRKELCQEALRLNRILLESEKTNSAYTRSLMSLMCFHTARLITRIDANGVPISLEFQNRSKWDRRLIEEGNFYLNTISHDQINEYFLQAAIISIHTNSRTYKDTSWSSICALYQRLYNMKPNAMVGLNHVIALQKSAGATIAKSHLNSLAKLYNYKKTPLYHAVLSELEIDLDNLNLAQVHLSTAISLTKSESEKLFFTKKLAQLFDGNASSKS